MLYLHPNHSIDEEDKGHQQGNIGQGLERLDEGVEKLANGLTLGEQLYLGGWSDIVRS